MFPEKENIPSGGTFSTKSSFSAHSSEKVLLAVIATGLVFLITLISFLYDFILSLKEYIPLKGIFNSDNVGLANYQNFFSSVYFVRLLSNTIVQSLLFGIFIFLISLILETIITYLSPKSILSSILVTLTLIPVFIPDVVYVSWFINLFSPATPFMTPYIAKWFIPLIRALKYAGIPALVTFVIHEKTHEEKTNKNFSLALKVSGCFSLFSIMFINVNDVTITTLAVNPLIYETIDSFNLFAYRTGLLSADYSQAAAVSIISRLLCLITVAILYFPFKVLAGDIFHRILHSENEPASNNYLKPLSSTVIALILGIIVFALPFCGKTTNIFDLRALSMLFQNHNVIGAFTLSIIASLISAAINVALSAILSYPIVCGKTGLKRISIVLLVLIAVICSVPVSIGTYMIIRSLGFFNTVFALILGLLTPISCVWAFVAIARYKKVPEGSRYSKAISKPTVALLLVQFVYCFNNYYPSLIYITDRRLHSPSLLYREIAITGGQAAGQMSQYGSIAFWYGLILSIIPLAILAVLRICYRKDSLLSILGMSQRR